MDKHEVSVYGNSVKQNLNFSAMVGTTKLQSFSSDLDLVRWWVQGPDVCTAIMQIRKHLPRCLSCQGDIDHAD
jgi:hypothetical protein